jgi:hypothetical protein
VIDKPTHQVVITITSHEDNPDVNLKVAFNPLLDDDEITAMGYTPAAYLLAERYLLATEQMVDTSLLLEIEEGDLSAGRSIN